MYKLKIKPSSQKYAKSYCDTMDVVAREGKFLSVSSGYSLQSIKDFIKICRKCGYPQNFLINEDSEAVGWCDIVRRNDQPDDVGYLGVGILEKYRHQGWGTKLMAATIERAFDCGFNEIRLEVRASNLNAIEAYKKLGFVFVCLNPDGVTTDGVSEDVWVMSLGVREIGGSRVSREDFFGLFRNIDYKFRKPESAK